MKDVDISVVIVTYNCETLIEETLESVLIQDYENKEIIIIDGKSSDDTLRKINNKLYKTNVQHSILSENDNGIYDAMNKGINLSNGEIIYFLNAGDYLNGSDILCKIIAIMKKDDLHILYGDAELIKNNESIGFFKNNSSLMKQIILKGICHQTIFAKKSSFENNNFDTNYKISSDFNWLVKCLNKKMKFRYTPITICKYDITGVSSNLNGQRIGAKEYKDIIKKNINGVYRLIGTIKAYRLKYKFRG